MPVSAPFAGTVVAVWHDRHDPISAGQAIVVLEAMKMEHEVVAEVDGTVQRVDVAVGDTVEPGQRLAILEPGQNDTTTGRAAQPDDADGPGDELEAVRARHAQTLDPARPEAIAKRHEQGR